MKIHYIFLIMFLSSFFILPIASPQHSYTPKNGFVPDEKTAIRVAEAVLAAIYGEEKIKSERPFSVKLHNGNWIVTGSIAKGVDGGVAEIKISKKTGSIISVTHGM